MALLASFKKTPGPAPEKTPAPATTSTPAPVAQADAKRHPADDVPENFPGSYAPPPKAESPPTPQPAPVVAPAAPADLDPRVGALRKSLQDVMAAVSAVDLPNFYAPDAADIAAAAPAQLVQWARGIARNLGCDGGASC